MSVEGLVKRLRKKRERVHDLSGVGYMNDPDCQEAADKLEELAAALRIAQGNTDAAIEDYNEAQAALAEAKRENEALREAGLKLMPYLRWTIGPESLGHHPTMPSAVNAFIAALEARNAGGKDAE